MIVQVFQFSKEQMIQYTGLNPFERFADGQPKVPDALLERLRDLSAEDVVGVLTQVERILESKPWSPQRRTQLKRRAGKPGYRSGLIKLDICDNCSVAALLQDDADIVSRRSGNF